MSATDGALICPKCGSSSVRRSRRANAAEMTRMMLGIYPFRCTSCGERFWANVWMLESWRWAKCPLCLNMSLTDWPKRHYRRSTWKDLLTTLGAHKHRCGKCRHNFVSFLPRIPSQQGVAASADDLDFDDDRTGKIKSDEKAGQAPESPAEQLDSTTERN